VNYGSREKVPMWMPSTMRVMFPSCVSAAVTQQSWRSVVAAVRRNSEPANLEPPEVRPSDLLRQSSCPSTAGLATPRRPRWSPSSGASRCNMNINEALSRIGRNDTWPATAVLPVANRMAHSDSKT